MYLEYEVDILDMMGFSKKRFLITLGLSILIWLVSGLAQALLNRGEFGSYIFGSSCEITGYPLALCIPSYKKFQILGIIFVNILFWFWVIHLFWGWFEKRGN